MSTKRSALDTYSAWPDNPTYIEFKWSDGNPSSWPTATTRIVDNENQVNFFQHLPPDNAQNKRWRHTAGVAVAKGLNLPVGPSYVLKSFPDGYRFFDHHKGPEALPRHDVYLYGSPGKRFRSIKEFIPHATWLMTDPNDRGNCDCKYCSKRTQKEVTANLEVAGVIPASQSGSPGVSRIKLSRPKGKARVPFNRPKERSKQETRVFASVQRVARPRLASASPNILPTPVLADRHNDLRAIYSKTSMELARWFREGEIVWCWLKYPLVHPDIPSISIQFWPGVVEEAKLRSIPVPRRPGQSLNQDDVSRTPVSIPPNRTKLYQDGIGPSLGPSNEPLPWTIRQSTDYKIQLLAVSRSCTLADDCVIPYAAHMPPQELLDFMQTVQLDQLVFEKAALSKFNPCPGPVPPSIFDAVPAYATALEIGSILSTYWCLTDDYEVKYSISASPPPSPTPVRPPLPSRLPTQPPPLSAQPAMQTEAEPIQATPHSYYRNVQAVNPNLTPAQVEQTKRRILGKPAQLGDVTQTRFQGMWWGAERIWTDDFVRLKVPRRELAPKGSDGIVPPSGPGPTVIKTWRELGKEDFSELGAGSRGMFLRVDGLFAIDAPTEGGPPKKEARVCGQLYELADDDWLETESSLLLEGSGGMKESASSTAGGSGTVSAAPPGSVGSMLPVNDVRKGMDYPLPQPPTGYRFRRILAPGHEFVGALEILSGRYYPRILSHPKLKDTVEEALDRPMEEGGVISSDNLWALEGLSGGYYNSMDPTRYKTNRVMMLLDADKEAIVSLRQYVERQREDNELPGGDSMIDPMDIDMDDMYA